MSKMFIKLNRFVFLFLVVHNQYRNLVVLSKDIHSTTENENDPSVRITTSSSALPTSWTSSLAKSVHLNNAAIRSDIKIHSNQTEDNVFPDEIDNESISSGGNIRPSEIIVPMEKSPLKKKSYNTIQQKRMNKMLSEDDKFPIKNKIINDSSLQFPSESILHFNLGDLEDVHHSLSKGDFQSDEFHLLRDASKLKYEEISPIETSQSIGNFSNTDNNRMNFIHVRPITPTPSMTHYANPSEISNNSSSRDHLNLTQNSSSSSNSSVLNNNGQNVYKISSKATQMKTKIKERELLKKDEIPKSSTGSIVSGRANSNFLIGMSNFSHYEVATNGSRKSQNYFRILINFYDHFYWESSQIHSKVSTLCGIQMQYYLTGLNRNLEWAQKAYDSSGHYRGQFFFGNDAWLGEKTFCEEINRIQNTDENGGKTFDFTFFIARIRIKFPSGGNTKAKYIQLGECLPKSCTTEDIRSILELDPHTKMFSERSANFSKNSEQVKVIYVRPIPAQFNLFNNIKFQIFCGSCFILAVITIIGTIFEFRLQEFPNQDDEKLQGTRNLSQIQRNHVIKEKAFELYQINGRNENNSVINVEESNSRDELPAPEIIAKDNVGKKLNPSNVQDAKDENRLKTIDRNGNNTEFQMNPSRNELQSNKTETEENFQFRKNLSFLEKILLCFGVCKNSSAILSLDPTHGDAISCVHGMRVISVLWTIMVHSYLELFVIGENKFRRIISERTFIYQIVGNATFSVDSFFFISGLLSTLIFLRTNKKEKSKSQQQQEDDEKFSPREFIKSGSRQAFILIFYRYIRLAPVYLFVIFLNGFFVRYIFDGSLFEPNKVFDHFTCTEYWWRNILFINNWYPFNEICMMWSWYLANDMQFYIMAILLLILSKRYFKISTTIILIFLITSWGTSGIISLHYRYTHKVASPFESFDFLYDKPWQRIGTFIVGMATGYVIHTIKTPPKIPFLVNFLLWCISVGILFILTFGVWEGQLSVLTTAFYVSIGHTAWGISLMWITLSCCWGLAPLTNRILSYKGFLPLSRLTYCTYLIHPVIMLIISYHMGGPIRLEHSMIIIVFLGNAVFSFMIAFVVSTIFEAPVIRLLKLFFHK